MGRKERENDRHVTFIAVFCLAWCRQQATGSGASKSCVHDQGHTPTSRVLSDAVEVSYSEYTPYTCMRIIVT